MDTSNTSKKYINTNKEPLLKKYNSLLSIYAASCKDISQKPVITYAYYVKHMRRLIALFHFIHQIYRITFKKDMPQINLFDAITMRRYAEAERTYGDFVYFSAPITPINIITRIQPNNIIPIAYYNHNMPEDAQFVLRFSHTNTRSLSVSHGGGRFSAGGADYKEYYDKLLYSTILHRAIRLTFKANKIVFNGEPARKYTDDIASILPYASYMSILPSHITLNIVDFVEDDKDIIPFFGDNIRGLLLSINKLHAGFREDYEITSDNHGYEKQLSDIKGYSDDDTIRTILYTINNNNYNSANIYKAKGDAASATAAAATAAYYYWFRYNSPLPAITILDTHTYISGIQTFQPFRITPARLLSITQYYIGSQEPYSRIVNSAIQNYIANGVVMEKDAYRRVRYLLKFCAEARHNPDNNKKTIYVFHGTHKDFASHISHASPDLVLTSFLSCTFNISIALRYAYENTRNSGSVYILEIKDDIEYINFNDDLYQIILQPSTRVIVTNTVVVGGVKYNLCKVSNTPREYMEVLYNNIFEGGKKRLYKIKNFKIYKGKEAYPRAIAAPVSDAAAADAAYICLGTQINEDIIPNSYFNVKYTLHQHFICDCYKFFKCNVVDYTIYYDAAASGFHTGYNKDPTYEPITTRSRDYGRFNYNFDNLFIDSLLLNDDVLYPQNYMKNTKRRFEYRLSSLRTVGLFDYEGYKKIGFNINGNKYLDILREYISRNEDTSDLFIRDITRDYMRMVIVNNIPYLRDFHDNFVDMLRDNYIDFITTNMKIDDTTEEYGDLVEMFRELAAYLKNTAGYYVVNMENGKIYKEIEPLIYDATAMKTDEGATATGGKMETLSRRRIVATAKTKSATGTKKASPLSLLSPPSVLSVPSPPLTDNNNKGYVMSYDDFVKIIDKLRIANNK